MDNEDDLNLGEYYDNRDLFPQPDLENMACESLSSGESQPSSPNDNSQPIEVGTEPNEPDIEEVIKKRKRTCSVWDNFKLEKIDVSGGNTDEMAICKFCKSSLSCKSSNSIGHLKRHANKCLEKHRSKSDPTQSQLSRKDYDSVGAFKYSHARMREGLAKLLAAEELPFSFAESPNFERFRRVLPTGV
ncbi:hypothetical protein ACLB2K_051009 [Fragaria x ananassa]